MFMEMVVGCLLVLILLLVQYYTITIAFRPAMAGKFQYTNFSQYFYDIEILLSTGSNPLTSKSSGAKQWSKANREPEACVIWVRNVLNNVFIAKQRRTLEEKKRSSVLQLAVMTRLS